MDANEPVGLHAPAHTPEDEEDARATTASQSPEGEGEGVTYDGKRFVIPPMRGVMTQLFLPWHWRVMQLVTWAFFLLNWWAFFARLPLWCYYGLTLLWRALYNVGLGFVLKKQSETQFLTVWVASLKPESLSYRLLRRLLCNFMGPSFVFEDMPPAYNAWLLFRNCVDVVLANDVLAFLVFALRHFDPVDSSLDVLSLVVGLALGLVSLWAKVDAHGVVGDYAWYWGDFFYGKDCELIFGGVFNMFPHPMYTIAYAWYYAAFFVTRNPAVAVMGIIAHLSQMAFLVLVETPHMDKIYGSEDYETADREELARQGYVSDKEPVFLYNIDLTSAHGVGLCVTLIYITLFHMLDIDVRWFVAHAVLWRVVYNGVCGLLLHRQSVSESWTARFLKAGKTRQHAFEQWKRLYNLVLTITYTSFALCGMRLFKPPEQLFNPEFLACLAVATASFALQYWSSTSTWRALGPTGWYFGDFFIRDITFKMTYAGIYRYSNNPDTIISYVGLYGLAILCRSKTLASLALFSQLCQFAFLRFVEMPHSKMLYGENQRHDAALWATIKEKVRKARKLQEDPQERKRFVRRLRAALSAKTKEFTTTAKEAVVEDLKMHLQRATGDLERMRAWFQRQRSRNARPSALGESLRGVLREVDELKLQVATLGQRLVRSSTLFSTQDAEDDGVESPGSGSEAPPPSPSRMKQE